MKQLNKMIIVIFAIVFCYILFLLFFIDGIDYYLKKDFLLPNILVFMLIIPIFLIYYLKKQKIKDITNKKYYLWLVVIFLGTFLAQLILTNYIYFYTDWDVKIIREIVDEFLKNGNLNNNYYLTIYPNNILLTMILVVIKSVPIIGENYIFLLGINALLVSLAGLFTSLTIKNILSKQSALMSYLILIPLIILSPWIVIPYTDTFAILFPILVLYLYSKKTKQIKDWFLIAFFSFIGYYIKPTVLIVLMAITIVELINFTKSKNYKQYIKIVGVMLLGLLLAITINIFSLKTLKFHPIENKTSFSFIHYLAMGQNNKTLGVYSPEDIKDSITKGKRNDINKFWNRLSNRTLIEQIEFFSKKTLLNFNDGSFSWGQEGKFFYQEVKNKSPIAKKLRQIYYSSGKYYDYFIQISQILWLIVLAFCPFIIKINNNKKELVVMLSIIGIFLFLTIFEPRTRYLYCYSPIFVVCFMLGITNLKLIIKRKSKKKELAA